MKWTHEQLEALPEAAKKRNAHLFKPVGGLSNSEREPNPVQTLESRPTVQRRSKRRVAVVVTIISLRNRETDDDNIVAGAKSIRDAIARSLAVDDGDKRLKWEYRSIVTAGQPGTQVAITLKQL